MHFRKCITFHTPRLFVVDTSLTLFIWSEKCYVLFSLRWIYGVSLLSLLIWIHRVSSHDKNPAEVTEASDCHSLFQSRKARIIWSCCPQMFLSFVKPQSCFCSNFRMWWNHDEKMEGTTTQTANHISVVLNFSPDNQCRQFALLFSPTLHSFL